MGEGGRQDRERGGRGRRAERERGEGDKTDRERGGKGEAGREREREGWGREGEIERERDCVWCV